MEPYHLSRFCITTKLKLPTLQHRTSRPYLTEARVVDILGISPHRVYLVSLQHYLYILSVALVLTFRWMGVTHYATLWCPDFPPRLGGTIRRSAVQTYDKFDSDNNKIGLTLTLLLK